MPLNPTLARIRTQQDRAYGLLEGAAANKQREHMNRLNAIIHILEDCDLRFSNMMQLVLESEIALDEIEYGKRPKSESFHITVTQGMINQKILPFTRLVREWPFREGGKIEIDFGGSVGVVRSEILPGTKMLKARGVVGRFYREQGVKVGDILKLEPIIGSRWSLLRLTPYRY